MRQEKRMNRTPALTEQLCLLLARITALTANGSLHWKKQAHSSHRYAQWEHIVLILGPDAPLEDHQTIRYLHITPLFSVERVEIKSDDPDLRLPLLALVYAVEAATAHQHQQSTDPLSLTDELLKLFSK
jgi:hypothetical protein